MKNSVKLVCCRRRGQQHTLIICSCTPSSVCGPWKQAQMVSMILSMSFLPGAVLSGALPVKWPYAMSFCRSDAHTVCLRIQPARLYCYVCTMTSVNLLHTFTCLFKSHTQIKNFGISTNHTVDCHIETLMQTFGGEGVCSPNHPAADL